MFCLPNQIIYNFYRVVLPTNNILQDSAPVHEILPLGWNRTDLPVKIKAKWRCELFCIAAIHEIYCKLDCGPFFTCVLVCTPNHGFLREILELSNFYFNKWILFNCFFMYFTHYKMWKYCHIESKFNLLKNTK